MTTEELDYRNIVFYGLEYGRDDCMKLLSVINTICDTSLFTINNNLHTTLLYLGCKKDVRALDLEPFIDNEFVVKVTQVAISNNYIVCGIEICDEKLPYYGSQIRHITVGICQTDKMVKIYADNSPTAFVEGQLTLLENPIKMTGKLTKRYKKYKKD